MSDLPVACALDPATLETRREGLLRDLVRRAESRESRPDCCALRFTPSDETLALIVRTINAERRCCRFLRFTLVVEPDEGPMHLNLTGPAGTTAFLSALFEE